VNTLAAIAMAIWVALSAASLRIWIPTRQTVRPPLLARTGPLIATVVALAAGTAAVAALAGLAAPLSGHWPWAVHGLAATAALLTGGPMTAGLLALADATTRPVSPRVQPTILRGGAWIGALERLAMAAAILAGWGAGIAVIVAVKGLGRYPELRAGQGTGAAERFIIGTLASLGWAAACAGIGLLLL
jgi:hypothetical protein